MRAVSSELPDDIEKLQATVAQLQKERSVLAARYLKNRQINGKLESLANASNDPEEAERLRELVQRAKKLEDQQQLCTSRIASGITTFTILDPSSVSHGARELVGLRVEAAEGDRFLDPYYVFLSSGPNGLEVQHHTIPAHIPLSQLVEKCLTRPTDGRDVLLLQNLPLFARKLRWHLAGFHQRRALVSTLRCQFTEPDNLDVHTDITCSELEIRRPPGHPMSTPLRISLANDGGISAISGHSTSKVSRQAWNRVTINEKLSPGDLNLLIGSTE